MMVDPVDPIDDIIYQARQGSVSAIIQVLNEKFADAGVRTRAVFEQGVLQLLCEAAQPEQLEQSVLVTRVREILESIQPRRIRRVNINSRIVREQQLLWLEEINRDRGNQLLWSEEITLRRPNAIQRFWQDRNKRKAFDPRESLPKRSPARLAREKRLFWRGLIGGASLSLFLLLIGWTVYNWLESSAQLGQASAEAETGNRSTPGSTSDAAGVASTETAPNSPPQATAELDSSPDPFTRAVNLAETAAMTGQSAQTSAEWLTLAAQWQEASDLMSQVSPDDPRYDTAQSRVEIYRQNSEAALAQAERNRQTE